MPATDAFAQVQRRGQRFQPQAVRQQPSQAVTTAPGTIPSIPPVLNLLERADEAIQRQDWKLAIDSLQRIIDDPEGALILDPDWGLGTMPVLQSARLIAMAELAALPAEGIREYRVLLDGRAKGQFEEARRTRNADLLRSVVRRFLLTRWGDDAADLLISWSLDAGHLVEAATVLYEWQTFVPDSDVPSERLIAKRAAVLAMLGGQDTTAAQLVLNFRSTHPQDYRPWLADVPPAASRALERVQSGPAPSEPPIYLVENEPLWRQVVSSGGGSSLPQNEANSAAMSPRVAVQVDRIVARTAVGAAAFSADDLIPLWQAPPPESQPRLRWDPARKSYIHGPPQMADYILEDFIAADVALAGDLVMTIERYDPTANDEFERLPPLGLFNPQAQVRQSPTSRLVARDAGTGELRWQRGTGGDPLDPLTLADFRSLPVAINGEFWVTYYLQNDYYVGVLNPEDGGLRRSVLLCSMTGAWDVPGHRMQPVPAGNLVLVPSRHGYLFAVDAQTKEPRWAARYQAVTGTRPRPHDARPAWLEAGLAVSGDVAVLAPGDSPELIGIDLASGSLRWNKEFGPESYIIGADHRLVWLGGDELLAIAPRDGRTLWKTELPLAAEGRAVRCGPTLFVPTAEGILGVDAATGEVRPEYAGSGGVGPVGAIACTDEALYSFDGEHLELFPDPDRAYASARRRLDENPDDPRPVLQLARLELHQQKPAEAAELLQRVAVSETTDAGLARSLASLTVKTLLSLADAAAEPEQALAHLQAARGAAVSVQDRFRTTLTLAERLAVDQRLQEACDLAWSSLLDPDADCLVDISESVRGVGRIALGERLQGWLIEMGTQAREDWLALVDERVDELAAALGSPDRAAAGAHMLLAIAESSYLGAPSGRARLALARYHGSLGRYEASEQHLLACTREILDQAIGIECQAQLARLYADPVIRLPDLADQVLQALESRYASEPLPAAVSALDFEQPKPTPTTVGEWVAAARARWELQPHPPADRSSIELVDGRHAWQQFSLQTAHTFPRLVQQGEAHVGSIVDAAVLFNSVDHLYCRDMRTGQDLWRTVLLLPESFTQRQALDAADPTDEPRFGVSEGLTAAFSVAGRGVFAVGLRTGKYLWVARSQGLPGRQPAELDRTLAAGNGFISAVLREGHLALLRGSDGGILWERDLRGLRPRRAWIRDDRLIVTDARQQDVVLLNLRNGELVRRIRFEQSREGEPVELILGGNVICGPGLAASGKESIAAFHLASGERAWEIALEQPIVQLFKPAEGYIGVGLLGVRALVLESLTGEQLLEVSAPGGRAVREGVLVDGTFVVQQDVQRNTVFYPRLHGIDVATGEVVWTRDDLAPLESNTRAFHRFGRSLVTVLQRPDATPPNPAATRVPMGVAVLDPGSGEPIGPVPLLDETDIRTRATGEFAVSQEAVGVGLNRGMQFYLTRSTVQNAVREEGS